MSLPKHHTRALSQPSEATREQYLDCGGMLVRRATNKYPLAHDVVDALIALFSDSTLVLRPATTRKYKADILATLNQMVELGAFSQERAQQGFAKIVALLRQRRGQPAPRTSRLKHTDITESEIDIIVLEIRDAIKRKEADEIDLVLGLLLDIGAIVGLRPCEWLSATVQGDNLVVLNAKAKTGRGLGKTRLVCLKRFNPQIIQAADVLAECMRALIQRHGPWRRLNGILAERIARICKRNGLRRISMYALRHIAIATWKSASHSPDMVAALAGHTCLRTAQHYAPAKNGWRPSLAAVSPGPQLVTARESKNDYDSDIFLNSDARI